MFVNRVDMMAETVLTRDMTKAQTPQAIRDFAALAEHVEQVKAVFPDQFKLMDHCLGCGHVRDLGSLGLCGPCFETHVAEVWRETPGYEDQYADQRAHNVAWMTVAERDAL